MSVKGTNVLQRQKSQTLAQIRKWITDAGGIEKIDREQLLRKMELVIGCTRSKGEEYLKLVLNE